MASLPLKKLPSQTRKDCKQMLKDLDFKIEYDKIQGFKGHCVQLRFFLAKLDIIKFPDSTFDSNRFIDKYKPNAG